MQRRIKKIYSILMIIALVFPMCFSSVYYADEVHGASSTIKGTCYIKRTTKGFSTHPYFDVTIDGKTYVGQCIDPGLATPLDGKYSYTGTLNSDGSYDVVVNSKYLAKSASQVHPIDRPYITHPYPNLTQRVGKIRIHIDGRAWIKKIAANDGAIQKKYPTWFTLSGAKFNIVDKDSKVVGTLVTDEKGETPYISLKYGTYWATEVASPDGYAQDTVKWHKFTVDKNHDGYANYVTIADHPNVGKLHIKKITGENEKLTKLCPEHYSLAGAEFSIYYDAACEHYMGKVVTDSSGNSSAVELPAYRGSWTYYVKETKAPKGYKLNKRVYSVEVTNGKTSSLTIPDTPLFDPLALRIHKKAEASADNQLSLEGAEYKVSYYKDFLTESQLKNHKPFRTWIFRTDKQGGFNINDKWKVGGDALFKKDNGLVAGLFGTYVVEEVNAPKGFARTEGIISLQQVKQIGDGETITLLKDATDVEKTQKMQIELHKVDSETGANKPQGYGSLEGARYDVFKHNPNNLKDTKVGEIVTDKNGVGLIKNLEIGIYKIKETAASIGYLLDETIHTVKGSFEKPNIAVFTYRADSKEKPTNINIRKTGLGERGVAEYPKGAVLELRDSKGKVLETWTSDGKEHNIKGLSVGGNYSIHEVKAPKGYIGLEKDYTFKVENTSKAQSHDVFNEPVPSIRTTALVSDGFKENKPEEKVTIVDKVEYDKVLKNHKYTFKASLVNRDNPSQVIATSQQSFVPEKSYGNIDVTFKDVNLKDFLGTTMVVFEKLYRDDRAGDKLVAKHEDVNDRNQQTYVPELSTTAGDKKDGEHDVLAEKTVTITDKVKYTHLNIGQKYTIHGTLMDKETGKPYIVDGKEVTAEKEFVPETENGEITLEFVLNGENLAGKTMVAFENVYNEKKEIAVHADITDENQSVHSPSIKTDGTDSKDNEHDMTPKGTQTIVDKVTYSNLLVGKNYKVKGVLMDKETGKPFTVGGKQVTAEKEFVATQANGSINLEYTFDASGLDGKTVVVYENLYRDDKHVAIHEDISDENQSVHYGKIKTTAGDKTDKQHDLSIDGVQTIVDKVEYHNLLVNKKYKMTGYLMDKESNQQLLVNGEKITAEKEFVAEKADGVVELEYSVDVSNLKGKTLVVFEDLYRDKKHITTHADITDEEQSIHVPEIKTEANDKIDNEHDLFAGKEQTIVDTVKYENLIPGKTYKMVGKLVNKETGKNIVIDGKEVVTEKEFTPSEANGEVKLEFTLDYTSLAGNTLVVFENLFRDLKHVAVHADIEDEGQTIHLPKVVTAASNKDDGNQNVLPISSITVRDKVEYENLTKGQTYNVRGELVNKANGDVITTSEGSFVAEEENGELVLDFTFDASKYRGEDLVVYETVLKVDKATGDEGKIVAEHRDINDKGQSIKVLNPNIHTTAVAEDSTKTVLPVKDVTVVDTVSFENLIAGKTYKVAGKLVKKADKSVIAENTVEFTPEGEEGAVVSGQVKVSFKFDATKLRGEELVAFERVSYDGEDILIHEDLNDKDQTVKVENPEVKTTATINGGHKKATANKNMVIVDRVDYKNLVIGKEYTVRGKLMDKATSKPLLINGEEVTATKTFIAKTKDGSIDLEFHFNGEGLKTTQIVAFEELLYKGQVIATHTDITDVNQTVTVEEPPSVDTGDLSNALGYMKYLVIAIALASLTVYKRKKSK